MHVSEVRTLLDYHYWARDRLFEAVEALTAEQFTRDMGNSFPSVRDTLVHIYGADLVWYERWQGRSPRALTEPAGFSDLATVRQAWSELEQKYRAFVGRLDESGLHASYQYTLLNGQPSAGVFWQMFQHIVNHGSYHRGQLTTMLRQLGARIPAQMDLIAFYRERQAVAGRG